MRIVHIGSLATVFALAACGTSVTNPDSGADVASDLASSADADAQAPMDSGPPPDVTAPDVAQIDVAPPVDAMSNSPYVLHMPPVPVAVGQETTQCVELALGNTSSELVRHIHVTLATGSHHVIVYRSVATTPAPTPVPCQALGGIQTGSAPIFIAQATESDLVVPPGVGISIGANQIVRLEEHFINLTAAPIMGTATVTFDSVLPSPGVIPADLFFWGTTNISVAAHAHGSADMFGRVQSGVHVFGLTAHEHHFGTLTQISQAASATAMGTQLYSNTNWAEPPLTQFDPPIAFDGTTGLKLHCEYMNTSSATVTFGESAITDEMCFFWAYYYPSHGFDIRF